MSAQPKQNTNWTVIENEYKAGQRSIRAIARENDISAPAITQKAKREGWTRGPAEQVKQATEEKLIYEDAGAGTCSTDEEIIENASEHAKNIVVGHRTMLTEYKEMLGRAHRVIKQTKLDKSNCMDEMRKVRYCVETFEKIVKMEREAYSMRNDSDEERLKLNQQKEKFYKERDVFLKERDEYQKGISEMMDLIAEEAIEAGPLGR